MSLVVVQPSEAVVAGVLAAPTSGFVTLLIRMLARSGRVDVTFGVLRRSKADIITLLLYDALGGAIILGSVMLLGITRPPALVAGFQREPVLAWAIAGALGPLVSSGIVDRVPLRGWPDFMFRDLRGGQKDRRTAEHVEIRFQASNRILRRLYEDLAVLDGLAVDHLRARARSLIQDGRLHFDDLARQIQLSADHWKDRVPRQVQAALKKRDHWPTDSDPGSDTVMLLETTLMAEMSGPVKVACRICEQRPAVPGRSNENLQADRLVADTDAAASS